MYGIILTLICALSITLMIIERWYLSKGVLLPVYWLDITISILYIISNTMMFIHDVDQYAMLIYNILNIYCIVTSTFGIKRDRKSKKTNTAKI